MALPTNTFATYEAIGNYFDEKQLDAEVPHEEYLTDPLRTPDDKLVVNIFATVKPPAAH